MPYKDKEKQKQYLREYNKTHRSNRKKWDKLRGNRTLQSERYRKKYPDRVRAYRMLWRAIKNGKIIKSKICSNCREQKRIIGHHKDYSKPLDVIWLCYDCHNTLNH